MIPHWVDRAFLVLGVTAITVVWVVLIVNLVVKGSAA